MSDGSPVPTAPARNWAGGQGKMNNELRSSLRSMMKGDSSDGSDGEKREKKSKKHKSKEKDKDKDKDEKKKKKHKKKEREKEKKHKGRADDIEDLSTDEDALDDTDINHAKESKKKSKKDKKDKKDKKLSKKERREGERQREEQEGRKAQKKRDKARYAQDSSDDSAQDPDDIPVLEQQPEQTKEKRKSVARPTLPPELLLSEDNLAQMRTTPLPPVPAAPVAGMPPPPAATSVPPPVNQEAVNAEEAEESESDQDDSLTIAQQYEEQLRQKALEKRMRAEEEERRRQEELRAQMEAEKAAEREKERARQELEEQQRQATVTRMNESEGDPTKLWRRREVMITSGGTGLAKHLVAAFASMGATVILVVRAAEDGQKIRKEVSEFYSAKKVDIIEADLSVEAHVFFVANEYKKKYHKLDLLINCNYVERVARILTVDEQEMTWATIFRGHFLLTNCLLDYLNKSSAGKIVNMTHKCHRKGKIYFDDFTLRKNYSRSRALKQACLAVVLYTQELAEKLVERRSKVTVNCVHYDWMDPDITPKEKKERPPRFLRCFMQVKADIVERFYRQTSLHTVLYVVNAAEAGSYNGRYFVDATETKPGPAAFELDKQKHLWYVCEQIVSEAEAKQMKALEQASGMMRAVATAHGVTKTAEEKQFKDHRPKFTRPGPKKISPELEQDVNLWGRAVNKKSDKWTPPVENQVANTAAEVTDDEGSDDDDGAVIRAPALPRPQGYVNGRGG